jgi:hypothetical protein
MSGGDAGVLELTHQTMDTNGNVLGTDTFEDNHDFALNWARVFALWGESGRGSLPRPRNG